MALIVHSVGWVQKGMWQTCATSYIKGSLQEQMEEETTTTTVLQPFVRYYPGELLPEESFTHYPDHQPFFISFLHLLQSTASSLFNLRA